MTIFEKLQKRLMNEYGIECYDFKRTRAGRQLKAAGAFLWTARYGLYEVGSCDTASSCLKAKQLIIQYNGFCEIEIIPLD